MTNETNQNVVSEPNSQPNTKFCKFCGTKIPNDAILCTACGRQVEEINQTQASQPSIIINNENHNVNSNSVNVGGRYGLPKNKWVAVLLCFFIGFVGAHKFYEGKTGMGIIYLLTLGLFGIGWIIDLISLLFKPNPYYV